MKTILNPILSIINQALKQDQASIQRLASLSGKRIRIEIIDLKLECILSFNEEGVVVESCSGQDCEIKGLLGSYLNFFFDKNENRDMSGLQISGDVNVAEKMYQLLFDLDIDWEECLSQYTGDVIAHQIMRSIRQFKKRCAHQNHRIAQNLQEYIKEEVRLVPGNEDIDQFCQSVDILNQDCSRLEARIALLENRINQDKNQHQAQEKV